MVVLSLTENSQRIRGEKDGDREVGYFRKQDLAVWQERTLLLYCLLCMNLLLPVHSQSNVWRHVAQF